MNDRETLLAAARAGELERVKQLVEADAGLANTRDGERGPSAVLLAVYHGHEETAAWLADHGAELSVWDAAALGRLHRVAELLEENPALARMHAPDGFSALGIAAFFGRPKVLELLLAAGADPDAASRNSMQVTALHSAVACRDEPAARRMAEALLSHDADPNVAQQGGWTPLHQAAAHGRAAIVDVLLDRGADPGATGDDGRTPADMAAEKGFDEVADRLRKAAS